MGWVTTVQSEELEAVDAFLLGTFEHRQKFPSLIRGRSKAPVIAMNDCGGLEQTLDMFQAGVDDVVRKPAHVRENLGAGGRGCPAQPGYRRSRRTAP